MQEKIFIMALQIQEEENIGPGEELDHMIFQVGMIY